MRQLNTWDAAFLYSETRAAPMHICSVAHFAPGEDGSRLSLDEVRSAVAQRLHLLPPFHQRVVHVPFGLSRPYWAEDTGLDLDDHLREYTLPPPGDDAQLAAQVARIAERPLDLSRPMWEINLIHGVNGAEVVMVMKLHHAAVDGASGGDVMSVLLDRTPQPRQVPAPGLQQPDPVPGRGEMLIRGLGDAKRYPMEITGAARRMTGSMPRMLKLAGSRGKEAVTGTPTSGGARLRDWHLIAPMSVPPLTPLNGRLTPARSWAFGQVPLDQVKTIKNVLGGTVNDVVMAICAAALRHWLLDRDALPPSPLVGMIPVSTRSEAERGTFGNRVSTMTVTLPTNEADPVRRLRAASAAGKAAKQVHSAVGEDFLADALRFVMPMMAAPAYRLASELPVADFANPGGNLFISNVPGPAGPLYLAGKQMLTYYPAAFLTRGTGLNMVVLSYLDNLDFGLMACPKLVPDVQNLMRDVVDAADELTKAAQAAVSG